MDKEEADAIVRGAVKEVQVKSVSFTGSGRPTLYRVTINIDMDLMMRESGKIVWRSGLFEDTDVYDVGQEGVGMVSDTEASKTSALKKLAEKMMGNMHDMIMGGF